MCRDPGAGHRARAWCTAARSGRRVLGRHHGEERPLGIGEDDPPARTGRLYGGGGPAALTDGGLDRALEVRHPEVDVPTGPHFGVGCRFEGAAADAGDGVVTVAQDDVGVLVGDRAAGRPFAAPVEDLPVEDGRCEGVTGPQFQPGRGAPRPTDQSGTTSPCQKPKTAPAGSAARAARPVPKARGPTAMVAPRSRIRAAVTSASSTAKYGVHTTGTPALPPRAPTPATGAPSRKATMMPCPRCVARNSQSSTAL